MKCRKCGTDYEGNFCPNCGTKTIKQGKLLGFRSCKKWKKAISIVYMIFIGLYILGAFTSINSINDAITSIQGLLLMIAPYVFLSNFKLRNVLPLFKKHKKGLSFLGMICVYFIIGIICTLINPATYCKHKWIETENVKATCTEDGHIVTYCDLCDSENTEYIDKKGHTFVIKEDTKEKTVKVCSSCGEKSVVKKETKKNTEGKSTDNKKNEDKQEVTTEKNDTESKSTTTKKKVTTTKKEEHKHKWGKATCEKPSTCKDCGATKGDALGHTTDCGVCTRCKREFRKQSPVTIIDWTYNIDYVGGVEWDFRIQNNTNKQIKYVTMQWDCYNAVGDLIYDEISWKSYVRVKFTGPLDAYATSESKRNTNKFYNYDFKSCSMSEVIVEYMDGTIEEVTQYHDGVIQ